MKKLVLMVVFAFTIAAAQCFNAQIAHAEDIYVGTSDTTGRVCYLVRDSIDSNRENHSFTCTLKMVKESTGDVQFLYYDFWLKRGDGWYFSNSQGYSNKVSTHTPIEDRILNVAEYYI